MTVEFKVGEVVMFFMEGGKLVPPPSHEELSDEVLDRCTWGSVESAELDLIRVSTDDGVVTVHKPDFEKVCFISTTLTPHSIMSQPPIDPANITGIRPIAEA